MSCDNQELPVQEGEIGYPLRVRFLGQQGPVDVSTATTLQIRLQKPTGEVVIKTAAFESDGIDGWIRWVTADATDMTPCGGWKIQGVAYNASKTWHSVVSEFEVAPNLE